MDTSKAPAETVQDEEMQEPQSDHDVVGGPARVEIPFTNREEVREICAVLRAALGHVERVLDERRDIPEHSLLLEAKAILFFSMVPYSMPRRQKAAE